MTSIAVERERRWLVDPRRLPDNLSFLKVEFIEQSYLTARGHLPIVRNRIITPLDAHHVPNGATYAQQTVKAPNGADDGMKEAESEIPLEYAKMLFAMGLARLDKIRHTIPHGAELKIELDQYRGNLLAMPMVAEIELGDFAEELVIPDWFGPEITKVKGLSNVGCAFDPQGALELATQLMRASKQLA